MNGIPVQLALVFDGVEITPLFVVERPFPDDEDTYLEWLVGVGLVVDDRDEL